MPGWTPCRWHSHTVRGQRIPRELLLSAVAPSSWFLAEEQLPCTALAKLRCFREGCACAGEERPCPAPMELQIMWKHRDIATRGLGMHSQVLGTRILSTHLQLHSVLGQLSR